MIPKISWKFLERKKKVGKSETLHKTCRRDMLSSNTRCVPLPILSEFSVAFPEICVNANYDPREILPRTA